jgi:hypothetical protein
MAEGLSITNMYITLGRENSGEVTEPTLSSTKGTCQRSVLRSTAYEFGVGDSYLRTAGWLAGNEQEEGTEGGL